MALEEKVPAAVVSLGGPDVLTRRLHDRGIRVLHTISTPRHSQKAAEAGVDAVICEGYEGGGHKGTTELTTFCLIPEVADTVKIPIVAAGGIGDAAGRSGGPGAGGGWGLYGNALHADPGVRHPPGYQSGHLKAEKPPTISIPKGTSLLARDLKTRFTAQYLELLASHPGPAVLQQYLDEHSQYRAQVLGDAEGSEVPCGQVAGLIKNILSAAEVFEEIERGLSPALVELRGEGGGF